MGKILTITCHSCGAQFRLDRRLFKGALRAMVRCRRCGGIIEARNPDAALHPESRDIPGPVSARPQQTPAPAQPKPTAPPPPQPQPTISPPPKTSEMEPEMASGIPRARASDVTGPSPNPFRADFEMSMKGTSKITAPPPVAESRENAKRDLDELGSLKPVRENERQPSGQRFPSLTPFIALTIGIALLLAGVFWITSITGTSITGISDEIQFTGVEAYYRNNREAGKLFVLRGRVVIPPGLSAKKRIRVHASVLNDAKGIVAEQTTPAGFMVPDEVLGSRNREDIEEELSRGGDPTWSAAGPTPDGTIPFMVIFFNVTDTVASYKLSARSEE